MTKWIEWSGGECPISDAKAGEYAFRFASGFEHHEKKYDAKELTWTWPGYLTAKEANITAYKLIEAS